MKIKYVYLFLIFTYCNQILSLTVKQSCINRYNKEIIKIEHSLAYGKLLFSFTEALKSGILNLENQGLTDYDFENLFPLIIYTNWIYSYFTSPYGLQKIKIKGNRISKKIINKLLKCLHQTAIHNTPNNTYLNI